MEYPIVSVTFNGWIYGGPRLKIKVIFKANGRRIELDFSAILQKKPGKTGP